MLVSNTVWELQVSLQAESADLSGAELKSQMGLQCDWLAWALCMCKLPGDTPEWALHAKGRGFFLSLWKEEVSLNQHVCSWGCIPLPSIQLKTPKSTLWQCDLGCPPHSMQGQGWTRADGRVWMKMAESQPSTRSHHEESPHQQYRHGGCLLAHSWTKTTSTLLTLLMSVTCRDPTRHHCDIILIYYSKWTWNYRTQIK